MRAPAAVACLAACSLAGHAALAQAPPPRQASTAADQIGAAPARGDISAGQLSSTAKAGAAAAAQVTSVRPRIDAPPPLAGAQRRDTRVAPVAGHDRCDPALAGPEREADCTAIAERRADDFAGPTQDRSAVAVDPAKPPADLVDGIVNGGTGSVVQLPK